MASEEGTSGASKLSPSQHSPGVRHMGRPWNRSRSGGDDSSAERDQNHSTWKKISKSGKEAFRQARGEANPTNASGKDGVVKRGEAAGAATHR